MASWADNRSKEKRIDREVVTKRINTINSVLSMFARDVDLQDDLKMPIVQKALDHWSGIKRMSPEEASFLQDERRCLYVMGKLQILQGACREAQLQVPLDHFISGANELSATMCRKAYEHAGHPWKSPEAEEGLKNGVKVTVSANKRARNSNADESIKDGSNSSVPSTISINNAPKEKESMNAKLKQRPGKQRDDIDIGKDPDRQSVNNSITPASLQQQQEKYTTPPAASVSAAAAEKREKLIILLKVWTVGTILIAAFVLWYKLS